MSKLNNSDLPNSGKLTPEMEAFMADSSNYDLVINCGVLIREAMAMTPVQRKAKKQDFNEAFGELMSLMPRGKRSLWK